MHKILRFIHIAAVALLCFAATGCSSDDESIGTVTPLVIEGWIEEGQPPVVIVTRAVDLTVPSPSLDNSIEKWCRVTIYDGDTPYILTGTVNNDYTPAFIYTTSRLKGAVGHTYRLTVETDTETATATSTMLAAPKLMPLEAERTDDCDTLYRLHAFIKDIDPTAHYRFFSRSHSVESRFYGTFLGTFTGSEYDSAKGWDITRGFHSGYAGTEFQHYYPAGERVTVRLCSMQPEIYQFWRVYDSNVSLSQNLFFTFAENCPGNIDGALGYWAAYGTTTRTITLPR